jgi:hypothetical protein
MPFATEDTWRYPFDAIDAFAMAQSITVTVMTTCSWTTNNVSPDYSRYRR